jgi:hypothetical protein
MFKDTVRTWFAADFFPGFLLVAVGCLPCLAVVVVVSLIVPSKKEHCLLLCASMQPY